MTTASAIFTTRQGSRITPGRLAAGVSEGIASLREDAVSVATKTDEEVPHGSIVDELDLESAEWSTALFISDPKRDQAALVKTIGERMRHARELCNLSQSVAAKRLGYANPSKLSKVEAATDTNSVPLWLIPRAAKIYEVSIDFLMGVTDDWEVGVPRLATNWLVDAMEQARRRDMAAVEQLHRVVAGVAGSIDGFAEATASIAEGISRFRDRNPKFDQMPAGSMVLARLGRLEAVASNADAVLKRFRLGRHSVAVSRD